jgi:small conductance mechanosensitive channel
MPEDLLLFGLRLVGILIVAFFAQRLFRSFIRRGVSKMVSRSAYHSVDAAHQREETLVQVFGAVSYIVIWSLALLTIFSEVGINLVPFIATAGVLGIAVGFGAQYLVKDILTGLTMLFEDQYRIGDIVCLDTTCGVVEGITLRKTSLRDLDGVLFHVPHGDVKRVSNKSAGFARFNITMGVAYQTDIRHVTEVINRVGGVLATDPAWRAYIKKPPAFVRVIDFTDSAVLIRIQGETIAGQQWGVEGEMRKRIKEAFEEEKIEIPLHQVVVHQVSPPATPRTPRARKPKVV